MRHYVYRGINHTQLEIYYGVSKDPQERIDGSHCRGYTKAISHWNCGKDDIEWENLGWLDSQSEASSIAHDKERQRAPSGCAGYEIIQTAGI